MSSRWFQNLLSSALVISLIFGPVSGSASVDDVTALSELSDEQGDAQLAQYGKKSPELHSLGKYKVGFDDQQGFAPVEGLWGVGLSLVSSYMDPKAVVRANLGVYDMELQDVHFEHDVLKKQTAEFYSKRKEWLKNLEGAKYVRDLPYEVIQNPKSNIDGYRIGFEYTQSGHAQIQQSYYLICHHRMFHIKSHYLSSRAATDGVALQKAVESFRCEVDPEKVGRYSRAEIQENWQRATSTEAGRSKSLEALRDFFIDYEMSHDPNVDEEVDELEARLEKTKSILKKWASMPEAWAGPDENTCFYAGWVSHWETSGGKTFCAEPQGAKGCGEGQIACHPGVFGNVCISRDYQQHATQTCNSEYQSDQKKHDLEVEQYLKKNPSSLGQVQQAADDLCESKPYADSNFSLCTSLYDRISKIDPSRKSIPEEDREPEGVDPENYRKAYDATQGLLQLIENHCMTPDGKSMYQSVNVEGKHIDCVKARKTALENLKALDQVDENTNFKQIKGEACEIDPGLGDLKKITKDVEEKIGPVCTKEEKAKQKNCGSQILCAASASVLSGIPIKLGSCDFQRDSCLANAASAILNSLWQTVKGLATLIGKTISGLASDAWRATKNAAKGIMNWFGASYKVDDASSYKCVQFAKTGGGMIMDFIKDPGGSIKRFFNGLWNGISQWMMEDAFCQEWSGVPRFSTCKKPSSGWECLSCKEKINGTCAIAGYLATEIAAAFFTGGAATAVKATGVGAKVVSMLSKMSKVGKFKSVNLAKKFPKLAKATDLTKHVLKKGKNVVVKGAKVSAKASLFTLKKLVGSGRAIIQTLEKIPVVKAPVKAIKFAGSQGKKFLKWYAELNRKAYDSGGSWASRLFKKGSKTQRAHASAEVALVAERNGKRVVDESSAVNSLSPESKTIISNSPVETDRPYSVKNPKAAELELDIAQSQQAAERLRANSNRTPSKQKQLDQLESRIAYQQEKLKQTPQYIRDEKKFDDYIKTSNAAETTLGRKLTDEEKDLIYRAHVEGRGQQGKNGSTAGIGNYTQDQLKEKMKILKGESDASPGISFSHQEIKKLMKDGVVGDWLPVNDPNGSYGAFRYAFDRDYFTDDFKYISFVDPSGQRVPVKVLGKGKDGKSLLVQDLNGNQIALDEIDIQTARYSPSSKDHFSAQTPSKIEWAPHSGEGAENYLTFRNAFETNTFSNDLKYISYVDPSGARRPARVIQKNSDGKTLLIEDPSGKQITLNSSDLQSVRYSSTSSDQFKGSRQPTGNGFVDQRRQQATQINESQIVRDTKSQDWNRPDYLSMREGARQSIQYFDQQLWSTETMGMNKVQFRKKFEEMANESHKLSNYRTKSGSLYSQSPGELRGDGFYRSKRPNAVAYYQKLDQQHGIGQMIEGRLPIRGLDQKHWPTNSDSGVHFYPESTSMNAYYELGSDYLYEIRQLIQNNQMSAAQNKIGHFYHVMLNARPYDNINNSLFANQANYLLKMTGHPGFSQGHLDHVMMRMSSEQIDRFWPKVLNGEVKNATQYNIEL